MTLRTKNCRLFLTALFVTMALLLVLAPIATLGTSRYGDGYCYWTTGPWRGSGSAGHHTIYARGNWEMDYTFSWAEIQTWIYQDTATYPFHQWDQLAYEVEGGEDTTHFANIAKGFTYDHSDSYKTTQHFLWDDDGDGSYLQDWIYDGPITI